MSRAARPSWQLVLMVGAAAVVVYFVLPGSGAKDVTYSVVGLGSVGAVLVGLRTHRLTARRGWQAVAGGNLCFVLGDGVYDLYQFVLHRSPPSPSAADAFYLAGYPLLVLGVVLLTRTPDGRRGPLESYTDAAIVTGGALAIAWHFLMAGYAHDRGLSPLGRFVAVAYPVMDLAVLFIVVRAIVFGRDRDPVLRLLAAAMGSMIAADLAYDLLVVAGSYTVGSPVDAGWLINYVLVGAAALHPCVTHSGRDEPAAPAPPARVRPLPLVALACFVPPSILLVTGLTGRASDVVPLSAVSIVVFALVVLRIGLLVSRISAQSATLGEALTVRESLESELRHLAFHDSLTGLANRALFNGRVERALAASAASGGGVAVCFCDLDGFKTVNDGLGHPAGDELLVAVGRRLATVVRPGDTVARLGGDEFAVLVEHIADPATALSVAERIVAVLHEPVEIDRRAIRTSASVGLAVSYPGCTTEQLLSEADSAMYAAKAGGKDRYRIFESAMAARIAERLELSNALGGAVERGEMYLQYQPQVSLADGALEGFEALIRWRHPTLGLVGPDRFVPLAEERGEIVPIGRWVLETACEQAAEWQRHLGVSLTMSVNLSGRQLQDPNLVADVLTAVALAGIQPSQLVLEMTESMLIVDIDHTLVLLAELRAAGVRLSVDDFGTGYSSLSYLQRMPVDELKIDKSFVAALSDRRGEGAAFVSTIIRLARDLGLRTVAEGVEDEAQRRALVSLGCDMVQGFLVAAPTDAAAVPALIRRLAPAGRRDPAGAS